MIPKKDLYKLLSDAETEMKIYENEVTIDHNNVVCEYRIKFLREILGIKGNSFTGTKTENGV